MDKCKQTCIEMFMQRGYSDINIGIDFIVANKNKDEKIILFLKENIKINTKNFEEYINILYKLNIRHGILIYTEDVTTSVKKIISKLPIEGSLKIEIELFSKSQLSINITKHKFQPSFSLADEKDIELIKKKEDLPKILLTDPIVLFYNFKKNDVIEVTQKSGYISYRLVV